MNLQQAMHRFLVDFYSYISDKGKCSNRNCKNFVWTDGICEQCANYELLKSNNMLLTKLVENGVSAGSNTVASRPPSKEEKSAAFVNKEDEFIPSLSISSEMTVKQVSKKRNVDIQSKVNKLR